MYVCMGVRREKLRFVEQANSVVQAQLSSHEDELTKLRNQVYIHTYIHIHSYILIILFPDTIGDIRETFTRCHQARK